MNIRRAHDARLVTFSFLLLFGLIAGTPRAEAATALQDCGGVPEGGRCKVTGDPVPGDCFTPRCFEKQCFVWSPVATALLCNDGDGNPCTEGACVPEEGICSPSRNAPNGLFCPDIDGDLCSLARCLNGSCAQNYGAVADGTSCLDTDGNICTRPICQGGRCNQGVDFPPVPPMEDLANVQVELRLPRVTEEEAYTNCCLYCGKQWLEGLSPTLDGPSRHHSDGGMPLRSKLCGTVVKYGVNDEAADPRDIMLNIVPKAGFEHFVKGFVNTACTRLDGDDLFAKGDAECQPIEAACLAAADLIPGKCVHAEITPADQFYGQDRVFLPITSTASDFCASDWRCNSLLEPSGDNELPPREGSEACVYGTYAYDHGGGHRPSDHRRLCCAPDAGHDIPEIHPIDAAWFHHPDGQPGWIFSVFQDDSNRYSFPHCGDYHNGNRWSDAPRDLTFRFPFQFPRNQAPSKICLRHKRTTNFAGSSHEVRPLNVTTAFVPAPLTEAKELRDPSGVLIMQVIEPPGFEAETQVKLEGCATPQEVRGFLTLRVAVGCGLWMSCPSLQDTGDPTSGFYYGEITFGEDCSL